MAIIKHIPVKNSAYGDTELYLQYQFDEETHRPILDDKGNYKKRSSYLYEGVNCNPETFALECQKLNKKLGKNNAREDVKAHHYIISFDPRDNITMEMAMTMGKEFVKENLPGHQAILAVHPDGLNGSQNIHCHIVLNSVRMYETEKKYWHQKSSDYKAGCKHRSTGMNMHHMKAWIMQWCIERDLHQVDLFGTNKRKDYWIEKRNKEITAGFTTEKDKIRNYIDSAVKLTSDLEELIAYLKDTYQMEIRVTVKTISFKLPTMKQSVRGKKLGEGYDLRELNERIREYKNNQKIINLSKEESRLATYIPFSEAMEVVSEASMQSSKQDNPENNEEFEDYGVALKHFMKEHPNMDIDEVVDVFTKEYNARLDSRTLPNKYRSSR